jgi:hypothetical protein
LKYVIAGVTLEVFDLDQGREHLADLVFHLRQAVDVLLEAGPLAPAIPLGELLGQLVEPAIVPDPVDIVRRPPSHRASWPVCL